MTQIPFYKYQGTGNDFVIIDDRQGTFNPDPDLVNAMCHRRFGIGADGLMLYRTHQEGDFEMVYYNSDGHFGSMCGNGGRCIVKWAWQSGLIGESTRFQAPDGIHGAKVNENGVVSLQMNDVEDIAQKGRNWVLDTGSPHFIIFRENIEPIDVFSEGHAIRYSEEYRDTGINVNFVRILDESTVRVRTYERGVEAETYSCGTGVIAAAIAAYNQLGLTQGFHQTTVYTKGGTLEVAFAVEQNGGIRDVWLTGPAEKVFEGSYEKPSFLRC